MSTGGSYINSSVSLISKALIRYEGTLYSINPQEATITLSNVKSYGTEDRKADKYLGPKDTLFEYIIFKANDIKELIVDEPLNDPAIVTATHMPSSSGNTAFSGFGDNQQQNVQSNQSSDVQNTLNGISNNAQASAQNLSSTNQANDRFRSRGSTPASSQARSPVSELTSNNKQRTDLNKIMSSDQNNKNNANQQQNHHQQNRLNNNNQQRRGWNNNQYNQRRNYNNNNNQMNRRSGAGYQTTHYQSNNYRGNQSGFRRNDDRISNHLNNNRNNLRNNQPFNRNGGNMMRGGLGGRPQSNKKPGSTFKTEFDFEKANEQFQQMVDKLDDLNLSVNGEKSEKSGSEDKDETSKNDISRTTSDKVDEDGNFYDKAKSFFDNISCEAIERTKNSQKRFDWKQERRLNAETFGLKPTYRPSGFNRRPVGGFSMNRNYNQGYRRYNNGNNNTQPQSNSGGQSRTTTSS